MSTAAAPTRRSTRSAVGLVAGSAAAGDGGAPIPEEATSATQEQPRKRQRKAAGAVAASVAAEATEDTGEPAARAGAAEPAAGKRGRKVGAKAAGGPTREMEQELWEQGYKLVAGVDEAGRGPLAGPVVAAACVLPAHVMIEGIDDSKKLSAQQREAIYEKLTSHPDVLWAAQTIDAGEIDIINILNAALKAMEGAAAGLSTTPDFVLVDGNRLPKGFDPELARAVVKGDTKCLCIAAASVIAKVTRDRIMEQYHQQWPQYNFAGHKGYCVPEHVEAVRKHGPCPVHRRTFAPIKTWYPLETAEKEAGGSKPKKGGRPVKKAGGGEAGGGSKASA